MKTRKIIAAMTAAVCALNITACSNNSSTGSSAENSSESSVSVSSGSAADMVKNAPATGGNVGDVTIQSGDIVAEFEIEGYGTIKAKLFPDIAPIGVQNFVQLAIDGYYDGKNIHRVKSNFMMQGGSENGDGTGGSAAYSGEGSSEDYFGTEVSDDARHFYGALCYANSMGRNSTQFYIVNSKEPQDISEVQTENVEQTAEIAKAYKEACEPGTTEYSYYEAMEKQYTNLAEMLKNATNEIKEKYNQGGTYYLDGGYTVFGQVVEGFDVIDSIAAVEVKDNGNGEETKPVKDIIIKTVKVYTAE
ncbi:MAG: peptidylprolyl isomerase [Oscillospiraceae bacterium]